MSETKLTRDQEEALGTFVFNNGKQYHPALFPPGDEFRGKVGDCYDSSMIVALRGKYRYVEGIARNPKDPEDWILHAWVTDGENAYDPTWSAAIFGKVIPVPTVYIGIELPMETVAAFVIANGGYKGVLPNAFKWPHLAKEVIKNLPV